MAVFTTEEEREQIKQIYSLLLEKYNRDLDTDEDIILQYPNSTDQMLVAANTTIKPVNRHINRRLKFITVSVPEDGVMTIYNNNLPKLFFSGESGTIEFPNGILMEDVQIVLTNTSASPARFNYRLIFSE